MMKIGIGNIIFAFVMSIIIIFSCGYCYYNYSHVIKVGNQPGWCENEGEFHAFIYDAYGKGEYKGNWSQVKNFLIYQHNKYGVNKVTDSPTIFVGRRNDIIYSLDEYIDMKDKQCGIGTQIQYGLEVLDPGLIPITPPSTIVPTTISTYDYLNSPFGKVSAT